MFCGTDHVCAVGGVEKEEPTEHLASPYLFLLLFVFGCLSVTPSGFVCDIVCVLK